MHVGVVGLGTAGAASAIFLARQGLRVTIFEKTPQEKLSGAGAGIGLQPIGLRVLQRLGLLEPILDHGHRIDRLHARTEHGTTVLDLACAPEFLPRLLPTWCGPVILAGSDDGLTRRAPSSDADFRPELFGLGIHRDVLFRELHAVC